MLSQRRKKKQRQDQAQQQQMIEAQAKAQAETAEKVAMAEVQKQQALAQSQLQIEKGKSDFEIQRIQTEGEIKQQLLAAKFEFDKQLKQMDIGSMQQKEALIEDRKDTRVKMEGTQQSLLQNQRENMTPPINFEQGQGAEVPSTPSSLL